MGKRGGSFIVEKGYPLTSPRLRGRVGKSWKGQMGKDFPYKGCRGIPGEREAWVRGRKGGGLKIAN